MHAVGAGAETVLVLHATGFHGRAYAPLAECLRKERPDARVLLPDLPFHGGAVPAGGAGASHAWTDIANVVVDIVDALRIKDAVVFGHSMGGALGYLLAARRPGAVRALVAYEPICVAPDDSPRRDELVARSEQLARGARRRRNPVYESADAAFDAHRGRSIFARFDDGALRAFVDHGFAWDPRADRTAGTLLCLPSDEEALYRMGGPDVAVDLRCPVLLLVGGVGKPDRVERRIAEGLARATATATLQVLEHASHFGPFEAPAATAAAVHAAAARAGASPSSRL